MILKIATPQFAGWAFYDNVEDLHCTNNAEIDLFTRSSVVNTRVKNDGGGESASFFHLAEMENQQGPPAAKGLFMTFYRDDKPYEVWANTQVYLLNDNGRTIERLI